MSTTKTDKSTLGFIEEQVPLFKPNRYTIKIILQQGSKLMIDLEHLVSSTKRSNEELDTQSGRSLMYTRNRRGPRMLPCGTPERTGRNAE